MSTPTDHSKLSINVLETNLNRLVAKMDDLELEDETKNAATITKIKKKILEYQNALDAKVIETKHDPGNSSLQVASLPTATNPLATSEAKFNYNSMVSHFKSNVPTLEPPLDVSIFLQRLQNCYNLYVKSFKALEPYFVQQAKGHLSMDILETLNASSEKTETFEELQLYLKKNYESRETPFQILNSLLELDIKDGEKIQEFAGRVERKVAVVATQISAKFKSQESNTDDSPMATADCFNLFGSMLVYDHLRKRQPHCFNLMVKEVDNCWRPSDLGSMAATLVDRLDKPDPAATHTYSARPHQKQQKATKPKYQNAHHQNSNGDDICLRYLFQKSCHFGKSCRRKHLNPGEKEYNEILQKLNNDSSQKPNQSDVPQNANVALSNQMLHQDDSFPGQFTSIEELQPEEVGLEFFENSGLVPLDSSLYSHN